MTKLHAFKNRPFFTSSSSSQSVATYILSVIDLVAGTFARWVFSARLRSGHSAYHFFYFRNKVDFFKRNRITSCCSISSFLKKCMALNLHCAKCFAFSRFCFRHLIKRQKKIKDAKSTLKRVFGIDKLERRGPYQRDIAATFLGHSTLEQPIVSL